MSAYQPPFHLTHRMTARIAAIAELLGAWKTANRDTLVPELRRGNRIRTIHASLAVEQNTLTLEQVTAVLDGKTVLGSPREIQEVHNTFAAYDAMDRWQAHRLDDLLSAHGILMASLAADAGHLRRGGVGVYRGNALVHMAPPADRVFVLMQDLSHWLEKTDAHPLIASAAFHYELEFIHPFSDGNGRSGRLWQTLILSRWQPILAYLPVETIIKRNQQEYYEQLGKADSKGDCSDFIEFMLTAIETSLREAIEAQAPVETVLEALTPVETPVQIPTPVETPVQTPFQILVQLRHQPELTLAEVAQAIGKSLRAVERAAAKLQQENKLRYHGPKKGGRWEVL